MQSVSAEFECLDRESDIFGLAVRLMVLDARGTWLGLSLLRVLKGYERHSRSFHALVKLAPENHMIDPSGEIVERLVGRTAEMVKAHEQLKDCDVTFKIGWLDRWVRKRTILSIEATNAVMNETITWINEHDADVSGVAQGGPYTTAESFIASLS